MRNILACTLLAASMTATASEPMWTFTPLTPTKFTIAQGQTVNVKYIVTNMAKKTKALQLRPVAGISENQGAGNCVDPFTLTPGQTCILDLNVAGSLLQMNINSGPIVCHTDNQCYQPSVTNALSITRQ